MEKARKDYGVPGVWVAVVKDAKIVYVHAYGDARLEPRVAANADMAYPVASISKQFVATAVLMLVEEGKLSLDAPIAEFFPDLTRAGETTLRQVLSHTSGYQDYAPQYYATPGIQRDTTPEKILDQWARKPLDFDPGMDYQYSNTGYTIAGRILEKAAGMPIMEFLRTRIIRPLGMRSVQDIDAWNAGSTGLMGYIRYGLGPLRVAPRLGRGWLFPGGILVMTVEDLARWDIGVIEQRLLKPSSYREMQTDAPLKNGVAKRYGLGIGVSTDAGHRLLRHNGSIPGYSTNNWILPEDRAAVAVFVNMFPSDASNDIAEKIMPLLFNNVDKSAVANRETLAKEIFADLQRGRVDRSLFTSDANAYFTDQALKDFASSLAPLGVPPDFSQNRQYTRGGMVYREYLPKFGQTTVLVRLIEMPDGKLEQYTVEPAQ